MKAMILLLSLGVFTQISAQSIPAKDSTQILQRVEDWNEAWKIKDPSLASKNGIQKMTISPILLALA